MPFTGEYIQIRPKGVHNGHIRLYLNQIQKCPRWSFQTTQIRPKSPRRSFQTKVGPKESRTVNLDYTWTQQSPRRSFQTKVGSKRYYDGHFSLYSNQTQKSSRRSFQFIPSSDPKESTTVISDYTEVRPKRVHDGHIRLTSNPKESTTDQIRPKRIHNGHFRLYSSQIQKKIILDYTEVRPKRVHDRSS